MAKKFREKLRKFNPFHAPAARRTAQTADGQPDQRLVKVYVEGYEDVAFWRGIFDHFQNPYLRFEISVPRPRRPAQGQEGPHGHDPPFVGGTAPLRRLDFDFLFADRTPQSREVPRPYMFHTYAYEIENFLCYAPRCTTSASRPPKTTPASSISCVSCMNIPARSTRCSLVRLFGAALLGERLSAHRLQVSGAHRLPRPSGQRLEDARVAPAQRGQTREMLRQRNPRMIEPMKEFEVQLRGRGLTPENAYLFMHGHTLMDNVVLILLNTVREVAGDVDRQDHRLEEAGRGAQERDGELRQLAAFDPRRTPRQRELHQKPALQTPGTRPRTTSPARSGI